MHNAGLSSSEYYANLTHLLDPFFFQYISFAPNGTNITNCTILASLIWAWLPNAPQGQWPQPQPQQAWRMLRDWWDHTRSMPIVQAAGACRSHARLLPVLPCALPRRAFHSDASRLLQERACSPSRMPWTVKLALVSERLPLGVARGRCIWLEPEPIRTRAPAPRVRGLPVCTHRRVVGWRSRLCAGAAAARGDRAPPDVGGGVGRAAEPVCAPGALDAHRQLGDRYVPARYAPHRSALPCPSWTMA